MPAYSFQERFVPFILALRKGRSRHALPGDKLYLYYGLRTKWCRKIGEAICCRTERITINIDKIVLEDPPRCIYQSLTARNVFAWADGFRPQRSTADDPAGAWELMLRYWQQTHELPFEGVIIYWKDFKPAK